MGQRIQFGSVASQAEPSSATTSITVTKPTGTKAGAFLVALWAGGPASGLDEDIAEISLIAAGFTTIHKADLTGGGGAVYVLAWKLAMDSEPADYTVQEPAAGRMVFAMLRYIAVDVTPDPVDAEANDDDAENGGGGTVTAPTATTTVVDTMILRVMVQEDDVLAITYPGGHDGRIQLQSGSGASHVSIAVADAYQAAIAACGTAVFTTQGGALDDAGTTTLALQPGRKRSNRLGIGVL